MVIISVDLVALDIKSYLLAFIYHYICKLYMSPLVHAGVILVMITQAVFQVFHWQCSSLVLLLWCL